MRWQAENHRMRHKRQLRIMKLQSQLELKRKERSHAQHAFKRARASIKQLEKERTGLVQARTLGHVEQAWQPAIVRNHHQQLLASTPIMSEARLQEVEMALRDNSLALRSSMKRLSASNGKLESLESELSSLYSRYLGRSQVHKCSGSRTNPD
ncbi:g11595 [Coccomyxa viridis]|uniref:G11595 protein n=1 Tax=Coccomyxa viridis TaxID=1274662 RepID=A0ABP1G9G5_9CHLO